MTRKLQIIKIIKNVAEMVGDVDDNVIARAIGTMLYDVPVSYSGMVSSALLDDDGYRPNVTKCCKEHFMNRQRSGEVIIEAAKSCKIDMNWLESFINECTTVHLTTSDENNVLSKIQNHPETKQLSWEDQYELAGIELVDDPGTCNRPKIKKK